MILSKCSTILGNIVETMWSSDVDTKWTPPEGLFTQSAEKIAGVLLKASKDKKHAMKRLMFYINRAGDNLSDADKKRLESVKSVISK